MRWFVPLSGKRKKVEILAFDIEGTGGEGRFTCGAIEGASLSNFFTDRGDMFRTLLDYGRRGYWLFAHNLEYDLPILAGDDFWRGDMLFTPARMLWVDYDFEGGKARFFDSLNLFPRWSIAALGREIGLPKLELPRDLLLNLQAGINWGNLSQQAQKMIERYCRRDAVILYRSLEWLQEVALELGGQIRPTIAGVSMDIYRRGFLKWPFPSVGEETNKLIRPGFYGGRVENFMYGRVPDVNMYDITSLYPSVQREVSFPHPGKLRLRVNPSINGNWWYWSGMIKCKVRVFDQYLPLLPYRYRGRLYFPTGELDGIWAIEEVKAAIEQGNELVSVDWVIGSPVKFNPFEEFIDYLFSKRLAMRESDDKREYIIKLILNALYGRFGLNPDRGLMRITVPNADTSHDDLVGGYEYSVGDWLVVLGQVEQTNYPSYINLFIASGVTAAGRLRLYSELYNQGEQAAYCDTDSIITQGAIKCSDGLGGWRSQMIGGSADLFGPKEYILKALAEEPTYRVKGLPEYAAAAYLRTGNARFTRALRVREALHAGRNPAEWVQTWKAKGDTIPKRAITDPLFERHGSYSLTRPWSVDELPEIHQKKWIYRRFVPEGPGIVYPEQELLSLLEGFGRLL